MVVAEANRGEPGERGQGRMSRVRDAGRIRALPPERRIHAAVAREMSPLPHECGVPSHGSPESGGSAPMRAVRTVFWCRRARIAKASWCIWLWCSLGVALVQPWGGFRVALGWPWGGFVVPISWLSTSLGVALMSHWVALCSPLSDFSFQLSAFQLLPNCGFGWLPGRSAVTPITRAA